MGNVPVRPSIASLYRAPLAFVEKHVPLPNVSPSVYHASAILLSVVYLYLQAPSMKALILSIVLLTDWLDGATARRYHGARRSGYITDVVTDKASEGFIFAAECGVALGQVFFLLWIINCALTFYSARSGKHVSMPLRFVYLVIVIAQGV